MHLSSNVTFVRNVEVERWAPRCDLYVYAIATGYLRRFQNNYFGAKEEKYFLLNVANVTVSCTSTYKEFKRATFCQSSSSSSSACLNINQTIKAISWLLFSVCHSGCSAHWFLADIWTDKRHVLFDEVFGSSNCHIIYVQSSPNQFTFNSFSCVFHAPYTRKLGEVHSFIQHQQTIRHWKFIINWHNWMKHLMTFLPLISHTCTRHTCVLCWYVRVLGICTFHFY